MKNNIFLILIFLLGCKGGSSISGSGSGSGGSLPTLDPKIEKEFSKTKDITSQDFISVLNSIPELKEKGSFSTISNLEFKQGPNTCVGKNILNIIYDKGRTSVTRATNKISGNCSGKPLFNDYYTEKDINFLFLYNLAKKNGLIISEGSFSGKRAFMLSDKEKDYTWIFLLIVNEGSFDSFKSEYNYLGDDALMRFYTTISPTAGTKIDATLVQNPRETGDIVELSEAPLRDLIREFLL